MVLKHTDFKKILECITIALGACSLVVLVSVIVIKSRPSEPVLDGMGGLETPGLPLVNEEMIEALPSRKRHRTPSILSCPMRPTA